MCLTTEFWRALSKFELDDDAPPDIRDAVENAQGSEDARTFELLATHMFWQVEGARRRGMPCNDDPELSDCLFALGLGGIEEDHVLHLRCGDAGAYHHSVMLNFNALQYLTVPTHMLEDSDRAAAVRDGLEE